MSRVAAIPLALLLFGLIAPMVATEQNHPAEPFSTSLFIVNLALQVLLAIGMIFYCGFAALHATQYLSSSQDRSGWLVMILGLNVLGACLYYTTVYQPFRANGQGRLMKFRKTKDV